MDTRVNAHNNTMRRMRKDNTRGRHARGGACGAGAVLASFASLSLCHHAMLSLLTGEVAPRTTVVESAPVQERVEEEAIRVGSATVQEREEEEAIRVGSATVQEREEEDAIRVGSGDRSVECDVPCAWPSGTQGGVIRRLLIHPIGVTITMSMEGEDYYPNLRLSNRDETHAIASTRFDSDVPMPYFSWAEYSIQSPEAADGNGLRPGASFIASNCHSLSGREGMVRELMRWMRVDSYGACLNNMPRTSRPEPKRDIVRKYAVHLAFENQCVDDYVTEKLWGVLEAGVIPVYYGAPNVASHVPSPTSIVDVRDFADMRSLARHLEEISVNRTLRASYHAWRSRPLPDWFVDKYDFTHVHSECRTCQWAAARQRKGPHTPHHHKRRADPPPAGGTNGESDRGDGVRHAARGGVGMPSRTGGGVPRLLPRQGRVVREAAVGGAGGRHRVPRATRDGAGVGRNDLRHAERIESWGSDPTAPLPSGRVGAGL